MSAAFLSKMSTTSAWPFLEAWKRKDKILLLRETAVAVAIVSVVVVVVVIVVVVASTA